MNLFPNAHLRIQNTLKTLQDEAAAKAHADKLALAAAQNIEEDESSEEESVENMPKGLAALTAADKKRAKKLAAKNAKEKAERKAAEEEAKRKVGGVSYIPSFLSPLAPLPPCAFSYRHSRPRRIV